jgi:hypothetical protein
MAAVRLVAICHDTSGALADGSGWPERHAAHKRTDRRRPVPQPLADGPPGATATGFISTSWGGYFYLLGRSPSPGRRWQRLPLPSSPAARRAAVPRPLPILPRLAAAPLASRRLRALRARAPTRDGKGSLIPGCHVLLAAARESSRKDQKVISNGFGFLGRAHRSRPARPAPGALSPSGPAAPAPGHGVPQAGARPHSSRPTPRAAGASRGRIAGTGGVPGRRRRPPSPWLSHGLPARAPRQGRTALDPPPGRRPTATSRTVLPPARAPCAEPAAW